MPARRLHSVHQPPVLPTRTWLRRRHGSLDAAAARCSPCGAAGSGDHNRANPW